jgi:hypothetical protein
MFRLFQRIARPATFRGESGSTVAAPPTGKPSEAPPWVVEITQRPVSIDGLNCNVLIAYADGHDITIVELTLHEIHGHERYSGITIWEFVRGYCRQHRSIRTFSLSRVRLAVDRETGQVVPDLVAYARARATANHLPRRAG